MGSRRYQLINSDGHVTEPPRLFVDRVPAALRDRAPRIEHFAEGDAWVIEGVRDPINFGMNNCAGLPATEQRAWVRFEEIRAGGYDPSARLEEMDQDGVDAEVLYPTPRLAQAIAANRDPAYHLAMIQAYNDWLSEFCEHAPDRFGGMALLPNIGTNAALAEIDRVLARPGLRGAAILAYPNGSVQLDPEDEKVFGYLAERHITLSIHVALSASMPGSHKAKLPGYGRFFDAPNRMIELVFSGLFDRHPDLDVFFAEVDFGWVPYVKEQIDNNYRRLDPTAHFDLQQLPSEYIERHFHFGYMTDSFGLRHLAEVGPERVLWSSDYPHISADWPLSWRTIQASFSGVPSETRRLVLAGNAQRLFGFLRSDDGEPLDSGRGH
jgi:predicted TIM-barrel fold metal-dependent hydrolase